MKTVLRYLSPHSPLGPVASGCVVSVLILLLVAFVAPPIGWAFAKVFGWWWRYWM